MSASSQIPADLSVERPPASIAGLAGHAIDTVIEGVRADQEALRRSLSETAGRLNGSLRERTAVAARLALILDSLPAAVVVVDASGCILQLSGQAADVTGAGPGDAWSNFLSRLTPTAEADEYLLGDTCWRIQQGRTPAGESVYSLTDVTASVRQRATAERERQLVALGQFAAHLAHQLRTPLSAALLHAGLLARSAHEPAQQQQVAALTDRLQHMQAYISHAFDQLGDHGTTAPGRIAIAPFLQTVRAGVAALAARSGVDVRLEADPVCGDVNGWRVPLEGAISNLLDNAIHFSPPRGVVVLRADASPDRIQIRVVDQGPGVDPALASRIFEPFVSARAGGTGLGLAIVRGVIERHGGRILLEPGSGRGATFLVELPRAVGGGR